MTHEEIRKLLGGYATNTLTGSERRALMEAALDDQELFNALQDEEALRQLLADPASREQVHQALDEKPAPAWRARGWVWPGCYCRGSSSRGDRGGCRADSAPTGSAARSDRDEPSASEYSGAGSASAGCARAQSKSRSRE